MLRATLLVSFFLCSAALADDDDDLAAMADGEGKDFVYLLCADCHSMQHVLEKRYTRGGWRGVLERMTVDFGMAELEADEHREVLDYLANNYGPNSTR